MTGSSLVLNWMITAPRSGRYRLTGSMRWAAPAQRGASNLDLRIMAAQGMHTAFGAHFLRIASGLPPACAFSCGLARVNTNWVGPFAACPPGVGNVADPFFQLSDHSPAQYQPVFAWSADSKSSIDRFEAVGYETRKRINGGGLGISLENRDRLGGGGYTSLNAMAYHGTLNLRDAMSQAFDKPPFGYDTEGGFSKFTLQFARLQYLAPKFSLFVGGGMQRASKNLDTYEKLSLSGPKAVRAYATGEVLVDDGWLGTVELRFALKPESTLFAFYDAAHGDQFHTPHN